MTGREEEEEGEEAIFFSIQVLFGPRAFFFISLSFSFSSNFFFF